MDSKIERNNIDIAAEQKEQQQPLIGEEQMMEHDEEQQQPLASEEKHTMRIFVAIDESDDTFYVLRWVLDNLFKHISFKNVHESELHDHLTLFHVLPRIPQYVFPGAPMVIPAVSIMESATKVQREHATELLSRAMQICKEKKVEAEVAVSEGDPKETICQATEDMHVDLLVVGSRGRGKFKRALLGSVSDYCAHHAKCPVVIVKPPKESHNDHKTS